MRIAALDLGSNSFHLLVVEVQRDGTFSPLVREKEVLRLGDAVARRGAIGARAIERALETLARFKALAEAQRADEVVALATSAVRDAADGAELVERARDLGLAVEVIDGVREAELIFGAIRASVVVDPSPAVAIDLGGGSLELMVGDQSELSYAASLPLGVGRLTARFLASDPPSQEELARLRRHVADELSAVIPAVAGHEPRQCIGSSGTLVAIARMAAALRDGVLPRTVNQLSVARPALERLAGEVLSRTCAARSRLPGCDARRAELLPAGVVVLEEVLERTGLESLTVSDWALREGIVLETMRRHGLEPTGSDPQDIRWSSALALCRRSGWCERHARQVATLALQLFDVLAPAYGLQAAERELLELGALVHDVGEHVSRAGHDRHTAYLVEHGGLRGLSPAEVGILATIGRYHVRGTPRPSFEPFAALGPSDRDRATKLAAILRLADALDASHDGRVEAVDAELDVERGELLVRAGGAGDAQVERWMAQRKKDLLERAFGVTCRLEDVRRAGGVATSPEGSSGAG
ncbi:MAG TPA: Ppx/GppA phosphatase family protein [Acidimicrobiales bacterium]|nr:Ppx/GppA phosphatase family protein [Acidimicrobiales bacterium]